MARKNRMKDKGENPAQHYFDWSSKNQYFKYWDPDNKVDIPVKFPFSFMAISKFVTVTGWNQKHEYSIKSNEIQKGGVLKVYSYPKNGNGKELLGEGDWPSIKEAIENKKGKWTQSIYIMLRDGKVCNLKLSGGFLRSWFDFQKKQTDRFFNDWVVCKGFEKAIKGDVTYYVPIFEWGSSLDQKSQDMADKADDIMGKFEKDYFSTHQEPEKQEAHRERSEVNKYENEQQQKVAAELDMHKEVSKQGNNTFIPDNENPIPDKDDDLPF